MKTSLTIIAISFAIGWLTADANYVSTATLKALTGWFAIFTIVFMPGVILSCYSDPLNDP